MNANVRRLSLWAAYGAWTLFMGCLLTTGFIEGRALWEPTSPGVIHTHPREIKGRIRFVTDSEDEILSVSKPGMILGFALTAVLFGIQLRQKYLDQRATSRATL